MRPKKLVGEAELAPLAKKCRVKAGLNRAQAARDLGVARQSLIHAEDRPEKSFTKLRCRIIERYSCYTVRGPVFVLEGK
jgi:DNA-binding XRE family transcriptional regulator